MSNFPIYIYQSLRINLGDLQYSFTWISSHVLWQSKIESTVISILLDDNANLGLTQEYMMSLHDILTPLLSQRKDFEEPE